MRRREFIAGLGGAVVWPLAGHAQQGERVRRVGVLMGIPNDDWRVGRKWQRFARGLRSMVGSRGGRLISPSAERRSESK
jgi:hypothetical protein